MFPRQSRLSRTKDIEKVFKRGRHAYSSQFYVNILANNLNNCRFAVIVNNKSGLKATGRNLLKRRIREAMVGQTVQDDWSRLGSVDCVVGTRGRFETVPTYNQVEEWLKQCVKRLSYPSSKDIRKPYR